MTDIRVAAYTLRQEAPVMVDITVPSAERDFRPNRSHATAVAVTGQIRAALSEKLGVPPAELGWHHDSIRFTGPRPVNSRAHPW